MTHLKKMKYYYRVIEWSLLAPALMFAGCFLYVAYVSMPFPYLLEWMEGQTIDVIQRVLHGQPLYVEPSLEYVPLIYPPFYYYAAALFTLVTGGDFFPARLLSFFSTLGIAGVLYAWLRKEHASWRIALAGACFFLATYRLSGRWFDMSRVDSLFLFLTLFGLYIAVHARGWSNELAAALLLTAGFFTKQSTLMIAAPALIGLMATDWRHSLRVGGLTAIAVSAWLIILHFTTAGWFDFYIFAVPAGHSLDKGMYSGFWKKDVFGHVDVFFLLTLSILCMLLVTERKKGLLYMGMAAGLIGTSYVSRLHSYGYINVLMPMHAFLALMVGIALARCRKSEMANTAFPVGGIIVLMGLASMMYNPNRLIPTEQMKQAGDHFIAQMAAQPGSLFIPELQYIQTRAGKHSYAFGMAAHDIFRSDLKNKTYVKKNLRNELNAAIQGKRFDVVIPGWVVHIPHVSENYTLAGEITPPLRYVTGALGTMTMDIYIPRR